MKKLILLFLLSSSLYSQDFYYAADKWFSSEPNRMEQFQGQINFHREGDYIYRSLPTNLPVRVYIKARRDTTTNAGDDWPKFTAGFSGGYIPDSGVFIKSDTSKWYDIGILTPDFESDSLVHIIYTKDSYVWGIKDLNAVIDSVRLNYETVRTFEADTIQVYWEHLDFTAKGIGFDNTDFDHYNIYMKNIGLQETIHRETVDSLYNFKLDSGVYETYVTSVDRVGNESEPSEIIVFRVSSTIVVYPQSPRIIGVRPKR